MTGLTHILGLTLDRPEMAVIVGSGGKTTLMFALAREIADRDGRVLTTTTTKIFEPDPAQSKVVCVLPDAGALISLVRSALRAGSHVTAARSRLENGKLVGPPPEVVDRMLDEIEADLIVVEADGSRNLPLKAPGDHEPVIPSRASLIVPVIGLSGLHQPLSDRYVFRPEVFAGMAEMDLGQPVKSIHLARVLFHDKGPLRDAPSGAGIIPLLNQADLVEKEQALKTARTILEAGRGVVDRVVWGSLKFPERMEVVD